MNHRSADESPMSLIMLLVGAVLGMGITVLMWWLFTRTWS